MREKGNPVKRWWLENRVALFLASIPIIGALYSKIVNTTYKIAEQAPKYEWIKPTVTTEFPLEFSVQIPDFDQATGESLYRVVHEACNWWNDKLDARICYATKNSDDIWTTVPVFLSQEERPADALFLAYVDQISVPGMIIRAHIVVPQETFDKYSIHDLRFHYAWVALMAHEIGHCLGLGHSKLEGSIMYPVMDMRDANFNKQVLFRKVEQKRHRKMFRDGTMERITGEK